MTAPVERGDILDGKYRVERILGLGGMGVVVAATHLQLDQHVAIKFLLPDALASKDLVARFAREAKAAAKIQSEHVARVIDVATLPTGAPYMVMEYLDGSDLAEVLRTRGAFNTSEAIDYVLQACEALAEAHAAGIVHRDLKPANLFLARRADGGAIVKVLDFGISKLSDNSPGAMTATVTVMGSPLYMSPEQLTSMRNVDGRADIWALGVILHELLTGHVPFNAETMPQLCAKILSEPPPPLRTHRPDLPPELEAIVRRCLQRDINLRFANVADLAAALCPFGSPAAFESASKVGRVLDSARGRQSGLPGGVPPPAISSRPAISRPSGSTNTSWGSTSPGRQQEHAGANAAVTTPEPKKSGRVLSLVVGIGGALAIVAVAVVGLTWKNGVAGYKMTVSTTTSAPATPASGLPPGAGATDPKTAPPASAPAASAASSAVAPEGAQGSMVQVLINVRPPDAHIFVDDADVGQAPYAVRVKADGSSHKIRIEAPGHEPMHKFAVFNKDVNIDVDLVALAPGGTMHKPSSTGKRGGKSKKMYDEVF